MEAGGITLREFGEGGACGGGDGVEYAQQGIAVAEARGDKQAAKEMSVFARRIEKQLGLKSDD